MIGPGVYCGLVTHRRLQPRGHRFAYRCFHVVVDLDALPRLAGRSRLLGHNRGLWLSIHDEDHGFGDGGGIGGFVRGVLREAGLEGCGASILMQTMPRILGFVFNPLTVYYCRREDGAVGAIVWEVHNTFGQRHAYVAAAKPSEHGSIEQTAPKAFHVSPFIGMDGRYRFRVGGDESRLAVAIQGLDAAGRPLIDTSFVARRRALDDASLARALVAHPFLTLGVVGAIHFEALRLLLKRIRLQPEPQRPASSVTIGAPVP